MNKNLDEIHRGFLYLLDRRTSIAFVCTNAFLGITQTLSTTENENKSYSVLPHRVLFLPRKNDITSRWS